MKFTRFLAPGSLELLNLRVAIRAAGCHHCQSRESVVAHGYLKGYAQSGPDIVTRGLRFFCTDRYSNIGCGRTFSLHWEEVIPFATLRTVQLLELIRAVAAAPSRHAAWAASRLPMSLTSAYRWCAKWKSLATSMLTWLWTLVDPPRKIDGQPDPHHLRHLDAAFPACPCPAAAFQNRFQIPICP